MPAPSYEETKQARGDFAFFALLVLESSDGSGQLDDWIERMKFDEFQERRIHAARDRLVAQLEKAAEVRSENNLDSEGAAGA